MTCSHDGAQLSVARIVESLHVVKHNERVVNIATKILHRVHISIATEWCAVCLHVTLVAAVVGLACALTHQCVTDDKCRTVLLLAGKDQSGTNLVRVVAVYCQHVPSPCAIFLLGVLVHHHVTLGRELYLVGIVEHDKVVQMQQAGNASCTLRNFFLNAAVRDVSIDLMLHHCASEACLKEFLCNGSTHSEGVSLSERT